MPDRTEQYNLTEMKTIQATEFVDLLNELVVEAAPALAEYRITAEIFGEKDQERTQLCIPRAVSEAAASAVFELRQRGVFCFPVLAPLDGHLLT